MKLLPESARSARSENFDLLDPFVRPSNAEMERALRWLEPWRWLTNPMFRGMERIPEPTKGRRRPLLFVGNHTIFGLLDIPLLFAELYRTQDIFLRSLGDHIHFRIPIWRDVLRRYGVVDGTRDNCAHLMQAGEPLLVFPGGGREVAKRKGEKYQLIWKERLGFAKMALRHECTIVPFAAVGAEDAYNIVFDANDLMRTPVGRLGRQLGLRKSALLPVAMGVGPLPRPQRLYFQIEPPIETGPDSAFGGRHNDRDTCLALRDAVKTSVEAGIETLLAVQANDPKSVRLPRLFADKQAA